MFSLPDFQSSSEFSLFLPDDAATRALGAALAPTLRSGALVTLSGPLGAGKTTFAQGLAHGLGWRGAVSSPTFVLISEYNFQNGGEALRLPLLHLDAYRLENLEWEELRDAGLEEFLARDDAVRLVEWPQRIAQWLPPEDWDIELQIVAEGRQARGRRSDKFSSRANSPL